MEKENKPLTNPSEQDVSSEEGKDVTTKVNTKVPVTKEEQEVEEEIQQAIDKLKEEEEPAKEEKSIEEEKEEGEKEVDDLASKFSIEDLNDLSGRAFKSKEDFVKHYKNLASFTGVPVEEIEGLREKAKAHDLMIKDAKEVEKLLSSDKDEKKGTKKIDITEEIKKQTSSIDDEVSKIKEELADAKFLNANPQAKSYLDIIKAVAKREEKELSEVFEGSDLESLINDSESLKDVKEKEKDLGVQSKARLTLNKGDKINDLVRQLKIAEFGGKTRDADEIKQKLVEEKLGIGLEDQTDL